MNDTVIASFISLLNAILVVGGFWIAMSGLQAWATRLCRKFDAHVSIILPDFDPWDEKEGQ